LSGSSTFVVGCPMYIWDVATGRETISYIKHDNIVVAAVLSPDGRFVASAGGNHGEIHIWDIETGDTKQVLVGEGAQRWAVGVSTDGR
jgi:WD40 repeat protein